MAILDFQKPDKVVMHQFVLGGGFGRRLDCDNIIAAAAAARAVNKPVKLIYSREDDMAVDFTRPLTELTSVHTGTPAGIPTRMSPEAFFAVSFPAGKRSTSRSPEPDESERSAVASRTLRSPDPDFTDSGAPE